MAVLSTTEEPDGAVMAGLGGGGGGGGELLYACQPGPQQSILPECAHLNTHSKQQKKSYTSNTTQHKSQGR